MNLDYLIQVFDLNIPLYQSISEETVKQFINLYHKNPNSENHFMLWFNNNINKIEMLNKYDKENIVKSYTNINITKNNNLSREFTINDASSNIIVQSGSYIWQDLIDFIVAIIFYIFSASIFKIKNLPIPQKENDNNFDIVDLSKEKKYTRIILLVSVKNKKYYVKITPQKKSYNNEILIYEELAQYSNIIKIYNYGFINFENKKVFKLNIDNNEIIIDKENIEHLRNINTLIFFNNGSELLYYVLECNTEYKCADEMYKIILTLDNASDIFIKLYKGMINFLYKLNKDKGFVHWDLHSNNILINNNFENFKFYDFDLSSTKLHNNNKFLKNISRYSKLIKEKINSDVKTYQEIGFIWDILRLTIPLFKYPTLRENNLINYIYNFWKSIKITTNAEFYTGTQKITIEMFEEGLLTKWKKLLNNNQEGGAVDYVYLYSKYKNKYLQLKTIKN